MDNKMSIEEQKEKIKLKECFSCPWLKMNICKDCLYESLINQLAESYEQVRKLSEELKNKEGVDDRRRKKTL